MTIAPGAPILADDLALPPSGYDAQFSFLTTTSSSYTAAAVTGTATSNAVTFTAPASGKVRVGWGWRARINNAANAAWGSVEVRTGASVGSGTVVSIAVDDDALTSASTLDLMQSTFRHLTGLTPGASYNARMLHKISGVTATPTATILKRLLSVVPIP